MIARGRKLYERLPLPLQRTVKIIPFAYRLGRAYRETARLLSAADRWDDRQIRAYQREQLSQLLELAIRHVPYYRRYQRLLGRDPFDALRDIEPVSKQQMQSALDDFILPESLRARAHVTYTGGSTGRPLAIHQNHDAVEREWAFIMALWRRAGYRPGDRRATFRGVEFQSGDRATVRENPVYNELLLSPFHLSDEHLAAYTQALAKFRPQFLRGYPSALAVYARFMQSRGGTDLPPPKAVLCGSEGLLPGQRELIEAAFKARVYSWYGMTEKVVLAGECENSSIYHVMPEYGITEILDGRGELSAQIGTSGEIVGTGFLNRVMPFIRYRLDDYVTITGDHCPACGRRHLLLSSVQGHRVQDGLIGRSGALISMTALNLHDATFQGVRQFQFVQREVGRAKLLLRVGSDFDPARLTVIAQRLANKTGGEVAFEARVVESIDQTQMGKGVYLRQLLPVGRTAGLES